MGGDQFQCAAGVDSGDALAKLVGFIEHRINNVTAGLVDESSLVAFSMYFDGLFCSRIVCSNRSQTFVKLQCFDESRSDGHDTLAVDVAALVFPTVSAGDRKSGHALMEFVPESFHGECRRTAFTIASLSEQTTGRRTSSLLSLRCKFQAAPAE